MVETLHEIFQSRIQISKELDDVKGQLRIALDCLDRGLAMFDRNQRLVLCNRKYMELYELPRALALPGTSLDRIVRTRYRRATGRDDDKTASQQLAWIRRQVAILQEGELQIRTQKLAGGRVLRVTLQPIADGGWIEIQEDITEESLREEELLKSTLRDELTKLGNRRQFTERLAAALAGPTRGLSLHLIEIGNHHAMLGAIGLAARDMCLKEIGRQLAAIGKPGDLTGRLDGDLFAIARNDADDEKDIMDFDVLLDATLSRPIKVMGHRADPGTRVASVMAPRDGLEVEQLLHAALCLLYK
jgi:diguanylate cyclase (GGDEF)-like protein